MQLFTVGPVMMSPETLAESGEQLPYFRTGEFSDMMLESERLLKKALHAADSSKVAFLTASGTGAMEAAVSCIFGPEDRLLAVVGGGFGRRFLEICRVHRIPCDALELEFGEELTEARLEPFRGRGYAGLLVNVDETTTGQLYDVGMLSRFCRAEGAALVADVISSFLADDVRMEEQGIDAAILSSQKALALAPGLSMVVMREKLYRERVLPRGRTSYYLDLRAHVEDQERGQTPFTPAVGVLVTLNSALRRIDAEGGAEKRVERAARLASYFRRRAREIGLKIPGYPLSNAVTPLLFDGGARRVYEALRSGYGITVTPSGGDLADRVLRVGHIGDLSEADFDRLAEALREVVGRRRS